MGHTITVMMPMPDAQRVQKIGREVHGDDALGINQSVAAILFALSSGDWQMKKTSTQRPKKTTT